MVVIVCHDGAVHVNDAIINMGYVHVQALQERFGGWNSEQVAPVFAAYAATMFEALGDKVTYWSTINEPKTFCWEGYGNGGHAPNIHSHVRTHPNRASMLDTNLPC